MTTQSISAPEYIAAALQLAHGEDAYAEAMRQQALNLKSGDKRNAELWQRVALVVDAPIGQIRAS